LRSGQLELSADSRRQCGKDLAIKKAAGCREYENDDWERSSKRQTHSSYAKRYFGDSLRNPWNFGENLCPFGLLLSRYEQNCAGSRSWRVRGNHQQTVFFDNADRALNLRLLARNSSKYGLTITGYCLMNNHVRVIAVPLRETRLAPALGNSPRRAGVADSYRDAIRLIGVRSV
jgi:hypothetical protein